MEDRAKAVREAEKEEIEKKSIALTSYLVDNVIGHLTEGLVETCKNSPDSPVD